MFSHGTEERSAPSARATPVLPTAVTALAFIAAVLLVACVMHLAAG